MNFDFQRTINFVDSFSDDRTQGWWFVRSPTFALVSVFLYLLVIFAVPKIMKKKKPFDLKFLIIVYNFGLVIWSGYMCILFILYGLLSHKFDIFCYTVDYSNDSDSLMLAWAVYIYYISKLVELFDTVFFILRKKDNQITFLHVYHHASMPLLWWAAAKYVAGGEAYLSPMINCFVHVCMYAYYALSAFGPSIQPYLWWKKYITMLQMVQFVIVITKTVLTLTLSCAFPNQYLWGQLFYMLSLLVLFLDFYRQTYKHRKFDSAKQINNNNKNRNSNGNANNYSDNAQINATVTKRR